MELDPESTSRRNDTRAALFDESGVRFQTQWGDLWEGYNIVEEISSEDCAILAPALTAVCEKAFLLRLWEQTGGTFGDDVTQNVYGLFKHETGKDLIVPLVNNISLSGLMLWLETLQESSAADQ